MLGSYGENIMRRFIHKWHRRLGITSAVFVILLVITGLLLNHTDKLNLQNIFVKNEKLLAWYHIRPESHIKGFRAGKHWLTQIDSRLYFDRTELFRPIGRLYGVVSISDGFVVALSESLLILTSSGEIIERISAKDGVPVKLKAIGLSAQEDVVIGAAHGNYLVDIDALKWQEDNEIFVNWSGSGEVPKDLYDALLILYRGKGLPAERIILDVHSGRILGQAGVLLVDFMAVLFLLLAMSGAWMWLKYR